MFDKKFFEGKKILVTGHTGFKGTWLSLMLEELGAELYGYALPGSEQTVFFRESEVKFADCQYGYIQDKKVIADFIQKVEPEIVIHLASHSTLDKNGEMTEYIFNSNVMGVVNLLEAIKEAGTVKAVLVVTSDKCYQNIESNVGYEETARLGAQDSYSTSKACQELVTECYRKSFFNKSKANIPIATARASNVVGGGDYNLSRLFPYLLDCFSKGEVAEIRSPKAIRPWQNVLDVVGGYLTLVQKLYESDDADSVYSGAFNFGPEEDGFATVESATSLLQKEFSGSMFRAITSNVKVIETKILKLDSTKAKQILSWYPRYSFETTMKMAAEFKKRQTSGEKVRSIALGMIDDYIEDKRNVRK